MLSGLKALARGVCSPFVFMKYKNIWGIKARLMETGRTSSLLNSIYCHYMFRRCAYVGVNAVFDGIPYFPHGLFGVFISNGAKIGKNAVIFQQVTIGSDSLADSGNFGSPTLGDNVYIGAGAKIIGNVRVGNNCRVGANAVVYTDMPDNSVAVCAPTRIIQKENLDNRFIRIGPDGRHQYWDGSGFRPLE
jgi:serine O-acetyltransferase